MGKSHQTVALFWWVFCLCAHPLGQQTNQPETAPFKIEVKVNKVLVPVVVRDAQHRAVCNLTKEDFQVFDQNEPQAISGFALEKRGVVENGSSSPANPNPGPQSSTPLQRFFV